MGEGDLEQYTGETCSWYDLPCNMSSFSEWFLQVLLWLPRKAFEQISDAIAEKLETLPAIPGDASSTIGAIFGNAEVSFVLELFKVGDGLTIVLAALAIRFVIRRLPIIG